MVYSSAPPVLVRIRRETQKTIIKRQLQNGKGWQCPQGTDKASGRRPSRQENTKSFSTALVHLFGFKVCFSEWFMLLFARTLRGPQLFQYYFIGFVCV